MFISSEMITTAQPTGIEEVKNYCHLFFIVSEGQFNYFLIDNFTINEFLNTL